MVQHGLLIKLMNKSIYKIKGMTCDGCVSTIKTKLELEIDISEAIIDLETENLELLSDKIHTPDQLTKIISSVGNYSILENEGKKTNRIIDYFSTYKPIFITLGLVSLLSLISFVNSGNKNDEIMRYFMGYFFIIFSFLKLQDIKSFSISFSNYDPITNRISSFGIIYPFIELSLGIFFLLGQFLVTANLITLIILLPQTYGIVKKLRKNEMINCACLGSSFNIPLSNLTVIENLLMCVMALYFLVDIII